MTDDNLNDWAALAGEWLKAEYVTEWPCKLIPTKASIETKEGKARFILDVEYGGRTWKFDVNKTNQNIMRHNNLAPKDVIGLILVCNKIKVTNPKTGQPTDSILIEEIIPNE